MYLCVILNSHIYKFKATAGQEDPFELDSNLLLSSGRHGEDVRGSITSVISIMKHRYLLIWLTYCISITIIFLIYHLNMISILVY